MYAMVLDKKRGKLDVKEFKCMFLEYCETVKAGVFGNKESHKK